MAQIGFIVFVKLQAWSKLGVKYVADVMIRKAAG
jgi:hypothetical protein